MRSYVAWGLLVAFLATTTGTGAGAEVIKGPYLQNVSRTGITIMWETAQAGPASVRYGEGTSLDRTAVDTKGGTLHEVTLSGLKEGTGYAYQVEDAGAATFKTAPVTGASFSFIAYGDTQGGGQVAAVARAALEKKPDILLHTGDIVDSGGIYEQWAAQYFGPCAPLLRVTPVYPVVGSHDNVKSKDDIPREYYDQFSLPGPQTEDYYSFEYSDVLFLALRPESMAKDPGQLRWLEATLAQDKHRWRIAYWHEPPYSTVGHGSNRFARRNIVPVLLKHGVDLVFCGHNHLYERSRPIKDSALNPRAAVTFLTDGGGGVAGSRIFTPDANFTAKAVETRSFFILVRVAGDTLTGQAISAAAGQPFDEFTLEKSAGWQAAYVAGALEAGSATENFGEQRRTRSPAGAPKNSASGATTN